MGRKSEVASPGNRTRVARMGILHDTTTPATLPHMPLDTGWIGTISRHSAPGQLQNLEVTASARLAQSVEHETLNLRVVGSSPTLGAIFFFLNFVM